MTHQEAIEQAWEQRGQLTSESAPQLLRDAIDQTLDELDAGNLRVAEKREGNWVVNQWLKKAVLLSFRLQRNRVMGQETDSALRFYDKVETKFAGYDEARFRASGVRVVPPAVARRGAYIARNVVLMPSFVNIGAYVDEGTMVDTWATVGSCAQIGRNVHLSGGVGIGGVLEPVQAAPTIIEDNCFIGARSIITAGVRIGKDSIVAPMSVVLRDVKPGSMVIGNPAIQISTVEKYKERCLKEWESQELSRFNYLFEGKNKFEVQKIMEAEDFRKKLREHLLSIEL